MKIKMKLIYYIVLFLIVLSTTLTAQTSFKVIVNAANPVSSLSKMEVQRCFLKKTTQWEDGTQIQPVDLKSDSPVREQFTKDILNKTVSAVKSYWQGQIFSGSGLPPQEVANDRAVLEYVRNNPGGIGYVSRSTSVGSGIKVLTFK